MHKQLKSNLFGDEELPLDAMSADDLVTQGGTASAVICIRIGVDAIMSGYVASANRGWPVVEKYHILHAWLAMVNCLCKCLCSDAVDGLTP